VLYADGGANRVYDCLHRSGEGGGAETSGQRGVDL
jgi:hypothetical protein